MVCVWGLRAGYEGSDGETLWILARELGHARELVADLHAAYPDLRRRCLYACFFGRWITNLLILLDYTKYRSPRP